MDKTKSPSIYCVIGLSLSARKQECIDICFSNYLCGCMWYAFEKSSLRTFEQNISLHWCRRTVQPGCKNQESLWVFFVLFRSCSIVVVRFDVVTSRCTLLSHNINVFYRHVCFAGKSADLQCSALSLLSERGECLLNDGAVPYQILRFFRERWVWWGGNVVDCKDLSGQLFVFRHNILQWQWPAFWSKIAFIRLALTPNCSFVYSSPF